jgi:indole-3-acetate monooxygenase
MDEAERRRQLTPRIVEALRTAGVFRMPMPAAWGGPEVDILCQVEIVEAAARLRLGWLVRDDWLGRRLLQRLA